MYTGFKAAGLVAALTLAAGAITTGPASARPTLTDTSQPVISAAGCVVPPLSLSCTTGTVAAGSDGAVDFNINTGIAACQYYIRDMALNPPKVVRQGAGAGSFGGTVRGLTNRYRLELRFCAPGSTGFIW